MGMPWIKRRERERERARARVERVVVGFTVLVPV